MSFSPPANRHALWVALNATVDGDSFPDRRKLYDNDDPASMRKGDLHSERVNASVPCRAGGCSEREGGPMVSPGLSRGALICSHTGCRVHPLGTRLHSPGLRTEAMKPHALIILSAGLIVAADT